MAGWVLLVLMAGQERKMGKVQMEYGVRMAGEVR